MTAHSKDTNVPDDPNLGETEKSAQALAKVSEAAKAATDILLRSTKKKDLEYKIQKAATEVTMLERDASVLRDTTEAQRRLADKQRELAELRTQLKREFPETDRRWWHPLLFWRKS